MQHNNETENMALLYAYGELDDNLRPAFAEHVKTCAKCQAIARTCAAAAAALPDMAAPALKPATRARTIMDYIKPFFSFRRLAPACAAVLAVLFLSAAIYKYGAHNPAAADYFGDNMYAEMTNIEHEIDDIFTDFELL